MAQCTTYYMNWAEGQFRFRFKVYFSLLLRKRYKFLVDDDTRSFAAIKVGCPQEEIRKNSRNSIER